MKLFLISALCVLLFVVKAEADEALIYGDPWYKTFDCQRFEFHGTGTYLLTSNTDPKKEVFKVSHKIAGAGTPGVTKLQRIYIVYNGHKIRIGPGSTIIFNGQEVEGFANCVPGGSSKCITGTKTGNGITIQTAFGMIIEYDFMRCSGRVRMPAAYRNCLTGMLGNFNGIKEDDLNTMDGNPTTGDENERSMKMGNSYANKKTILAGKLSLVPFVPPPVPDFADELPFCGLFTLGFFNPLQICLDFLGNDTVDPFYQSCLIDVSVKGDGAARAACHVLEIMVESCQRSGITVDKTWRTMSNCTVECSAGLEYTDAMPLCAGSCTDPDGTDCTPPDSAVPGEGCVCPDGTLASGDECVTPDNCGCMLDNGIYLKNGEELIDDTLDIKYTCSGPDNVIEQPL